MWGKKYWVLGRIIAIFLEVFMANTDAEMGALFSKKKIKARFAGLQEFLRLFSAEGPKHEIT